MNQNTQVKVKRNLAGLEFLGTRADVSNLSPCKDSLDESKSGLTFFSGLSVMRDGMTIVTISLRVPVRSFHENGDESYTHRDVLGKGTTFEMALFDLSAQLIIVIGDNEIVDTESLPILTERQSDAKSVRTDQSPATTGPVGGTDENGGSELETRSDNPGGSGTAKAGNRRGKRKSANAGGGGGGPKQSGGGPRKI